MSFHDFPGCISAGATLEESIELAKEALQFHIDGMMEGNEPIPEPSRLDTVQSLLDGQRHMPIFIIYVPAAVRIRDKVLLMLM